MAVKMKTLDRIQTYLESVGTALSRETHASDALTKSLSREVFSAPGKKIRPALLMLMYQAVKGRKAKGVPSAIVQLGAMIEMIHTASVIHDDIIDESMMRRGQLTLHRTQGSKTSILMGDFLYARSAMLIASDGNMDVLAVVSQAVSDMCRGQMHELANAFNWKLSDQGYFKIIHGKTGVLFGAACEVGAIMAGATPKGRAAAFQYGVELGLAFQIMDDVLDLTASTNQMGKPTGWDLREGRMTLPFIMAYRRAPIAERKQLQGAAKKNLALLAKQGTRLVERYGGVDRAKVLAGRHVDRALAAVQSLEPTPFRKGLETVARMALERTR